MKMKRILSTTMLLLFVLVFALSSRQVSAVVPQSVRCGVTNSAGGNTILNTAGCRGYITNTMYWNSTYGINGGPIIYSASTYAIPFTVNSTATLESFMAGLLGMGNPTDYSYNYNKSGAAFIVATMLGHIGGGIGDFGNVTNMIAYAKQNFGQWQSLVDGYDGSNPGFYIDWTAAYTITAGTVNTLHACPAGTPPDVCQPTNGAAPSGAADTRDFAWYVFAPGESEQTHSIIFHSPPDATNPNGVAYILRRECGNPLGGPAFPAKTPPVSYKVNPTIDVKINGAASPTNVAQPGDTITFTYGINNGSAGNSASISCTTYAQTFPGYHATVAGGEVLSGAGPATKCPISIPAHTGSANAPNPIAGPESVTGVDGTTICRSLYINPYSSSTPGSLGIEACVVVAAKPYAAVFGGDTLVGAGLENAAGNCTNDTNAGIFGWNREAAGGYAGAGSQYAALAMAAITDFASNQNGTGAGAPKGLMFANTTGSGVSIFGGSFGSVPCMTNYYNPAAAPTLPTTNVSGLATGSYQRSTGATLTGGNINPNTKIQIFIQGDVYIKPGGVGGIKYAGTWNVKSMPFFELVVKGNIYIDSSVTQLDGMYVAEKNGVTGGTIYTCATGAGAPASVSSGTYFATCGKKLTVNGSLVGNEVQLLRTSGSLSNAKNSDTATSNAAAESLNFSPAFWIAGPPTSGGSSAIGGGQYDSIASLPPIL